MSETQINVGMNVDGVITGTDKAKRKISELGGSARDAGNEASKGMAAIGNGGEAASRKVEAATRNTINSIQRQIAAFDAGDKSSRKYQESLARMRGIDVAALKPYLDQLDQAKLKQNAATTSQESMTVGFSSMKIAAYAAAAALGALGVAFKNIVNGVDALNDLKDATGASIENISALEDVALRTGTSFDTVGAALIKFNGVLKDNKAGTATAEAFKAIGVSVEELKALDPAEALRKVAVAFSGFADDGNKARIMQELFGKSTRDVAALMKDLAEKGQLVATVTTEQAEEAEKLNKEFSAMSKNVTDLARDIAGPLVSAFNEFIKKQREAKENGKFGLFTSPIQAELDYNSNKRTGSWSVPGNAGRGNVNPASVRPALAGLPDQAAIKAGASAAAKALAEQNKELETQAGLLLELSGYSKTYTADVQRLVEMRANGALTEAAYAKAVTELVAKQPAMVAQTKAHEEAQKELNKALDEFASANSKALSSARDEVDKAQASYDAHGKLASVLQEEALARIENWRIITAMGGEDTGVIDAQIAAKKELIQILRNGEVRDASEKAAKDMLADQKKAAEESGKYWEDALMRAFESGKGFFQSLWDTIKNTLKTQVLKVTVQGVMGTLGIGASGAAFAGGGGTDIFGLANTASSLSNLYSAGSSIVSIGSQVAAGTMGVANALGTLAANATGTGISGLLATNAAYGTAAAGTAASAAGGLTAGLAAIPGWGWAALGTIAVASMFGGGGETRSGATYDNVGGTVRYQQGPSGGEIAGSDARRLFTVATDSITAALAAVGSQAKLTGFVAGLESSENGKGFDFAGGYIDGVGFGEYSGREGDKNGQFGLKSQSAKQAFANYATQLKQATVQALQAASDVPKTIKDMLSGIDANALTGEAVDTLLGNINAVVGMVNSFNQAVLTLPFENLKNLSFDAAAGLIAFSGGIEALGANLNTYYTNFYSAEEQRLQTIKNINAATAGSGLDAATATKESFRALVDAQDLATESGQKTYAALMAVAGTFAQVADAATAAADAASKLMIEVFEALQDNLTDLMDAIASERGSVAAAMLQVSNPGVMTKDAILRSIAGTALSTPGSGGLSSAQIALWQADAKVAAQAADLANAKASQTAIGGTYGAAVTAAQSNLTSTVDKYKALANYFQQTAVSFNGYQIKVNATGTNNDAFGYNAATNRLNGWNSTTDATQTGRSYGHFLGDSQRFSDAMRSNGTLDALQNGNLALSNAATAVTNAQAEYAAAVGGAAAATAAAQARLSEATNAQTAAVAAAHAAQSAYIASLQNFAVDATKATAKLGSLREETLKYYEAQKQLADLMLTSAANLRGAADALRQSLLSPAELLAKQTNSFAQNYSMVLATSGATQAGYADKLSALLPELANSINASAKAQTDQVRSNLDAQLTGLEDRSTTSAGYTATLTSLQNAAQAQIDAINAQSEASINQYIAQSEAAAARLEANTPQNYAADTLAMLSQIDAALVVLDASAKSSEMVIADAIAAGADSTANGLRAVIAALTGQSVPAFASGGSFGGGLRLVGEYGPELEVTGPSRIFNANQTSAMLGGSNAEMVQELRALRAEVAGLRAEAQATAGHTSKTARLLDRAMPDGDALATRAAT